MASKKKILKKMRLGILPSRGTGYEAMLGRTSTPAAEEAPKEAPKEVVTEAPTTVTEVTTEDFRDHYPRVQRDTKTRTHKTTTRKKTKSKKSN